MRKKKKDEKPRRWKKGVYPLSVILVTGVCAYILLPGFRELETVRAQIAELRRIEREKKAHNEALRKEIKSMYTSEGIELAARRHLRLARPDEVIVVFRPPEEKKPTE